MAVIVEKSDPWKSCNSCGSSDDVLYVSVLRRVGKCQQGTQVSLCKSCAQCLLLNLEDYMKGEDEMPTIEERKKGKWIREGSAFNLRCPYCRKFFVEPVGSKFNFCPACGAGMRDKDDN